jgi:hypothetical protein
MSILVINGNRYYHNKNGDMHREDGPAFESKDGWQVWYINGRKHREDGPAVVHSSGVMEWWLNDVNIDAISHFLAVGTNQ